MAEWTRVIEIAGFEVAEKIRREFAGEEIRIPAKVPKVYIVPLVKKELLCQNYSSVAKKYNLPERTIRDYERWQIKDGKLISPDGRVYFLSEDTI